MARRRGHPAEFSTSTSFGHEAKDDAIFRMEEKNWTGKSSLAGTNNTTTMPLTQEKNMEYSFSNNNDHNYLHKKFKKVASTVPVSTCSAANSSETRNKQTSIETEANHSVTSQSIAGSHTVIEKKKEKTVYQENLSLDIKGNVQTNFSYNNSRISDVNNLDQNTGKTSFSEEFLNKTEPIDDELLRDIKNGTSGRYVCPYCKISCAKPSVLQKHIRAHTNERPYPCVPCGFAFKTKSNLFKHRRSRTHALRLQGADVAITNEDELSAGSESDASLPPTSASDTGSEVYVIRPESSRPSEFSSPELANDRVSPSTNESTRLKGIYKPKFRAAFFQESDECDLNRKFSANADFLNEHIAKIISENEAIVDVIETPLQKKYGKIKQIAESKQLNQNDTLENKTESAPLNLTKNGQDNESFFRKRSRSENFTQFDPHKHPLNPEGSIIKDLLLKTKVNGLNTISTEPVDGTLVVCPLCQIPYRSAENLEIHRMYYCKGMVSNNIQIQKDVKSPRPENIFMRSNSINVRLPETPINSVHRLNPQTKSPPLRNNKPDNLVIIKPETNDIIAPLPSPGPLLGNTRLVDSRLPSDGFRKQENYKLKPIASPKRRFDSRSETYSPRLIDNSSPRSTETYPPSKVRCIETNSATPRSLDDISQHMRNNSTSLQMFGGEVKIVDQSGSTTTLRIEPSKNQLSPIVIHQSISPYKLSAESETSNVVVRSGLHSGGTIVQNSTPQTPRITISPAVSVQTSNMHEIPHFQFPPLSAITAFNPLTLPPLTSTPNGASTIYHGGKLIPHVPGIPGPNTPAMYVAAPSVQYKNVSSNEVRVHHMEEVQKHGKFLAVQNNRGQSGSKYDTGRNSRSPNSRMPQVDFDNQRQTSRIHDAVNKLHNLPIIRIKNVDEVSSVTLKSYTPNNIKPTVSRHELPFKRGIDGLARTPVLKENLNFLINKTKPNEKHNLNKITETKASDIEVQNFNFETLITKAEIFNNQIPSSSEVQKNTNAQEMPVVSSINERSEPLYFQKNVCTKNGVEDKKPKFLRPSTLPLKPGTFTPKKHHGITPNANTMPLVSPETPRPAKAYGQLYLNGNAYTYLGLKCSTKVFYCTINRPQPTYVPNQHFLSMYSNWQLLSELTPDPLGLSASSAMALYDSRHRPQSMTIATIKQDLILTHSSQWNKQYTDGKLMSLAFDAKKAEENRLTLADGTLAPKKELTGGFESNEEYTYIRGRGRGRYVCSECGIRCKKPSMLKKHIRTHTDVRPYTCTHCSFSFKTKGNLTKHMKSKAHYKKCCELGINPTEGTDMDGTDTAQCSGETDDESDSDGDEGNEGETESSDTEACKSRLPEHEAAHSLLSLGCSRPATAATPGLITSARPTTYPYTPSSLESPSAERTPETMSIARSLSTDTRIDVENEPMDLSKTETKSPVNITEIPTARESSVLASLASNTAKLPTPQAQWSNGEPMLHAYLTERALFDSKIKQSQLTGNMSKLKNAKAEDDKFEEERQLPVMNSNVVAVASQSKDNSHKPTTSNDSSKTHSKVEEPAKPVPIQETAVSVTDTNKLRGEGNAENAKLVVSEYLKLARINSNTDNVQNQTENSKEANKHTKANAETGKVDDSWFMPDDSDSESIKLPMTDHDPVARKVVIGAGGVAFKVTKGKEFENASSYSPGRLMEDGRRVCDFCSKTFTKPSQLRLHLNIHYMERPFRCSACAVSFRTRGHLQKHERSGSHHNKVSMTSTFGAATSLNPRPFRCSDCNIAFRIHGHLAKHLRSKMHVMRLECLFKLPFGTFTEIERAGVSLTDIDTTDCASSLSSLQVLARKLHEKDPSKLEYRDPPPATVPSTSAGRESSDDEEGTPFLEKTSDSERDSDIRTSENSERHDKETRVIFSATDI